MATLHYSLNLDSVAWQGSPRGSEGKGGGGRVEFPYEKVSVKSQILLSLYLGCSGQNRTCFSRQDIFYRVTLDNITKKAAMYVLK